MGVVFEKFTVRLKIGMKRLAFYKGSVAESLRGKGDVRYFGVNKK